MSQGWGGRELNTDGRELNTGCGVVDWPTRKEGAQRALVAPLMDPKRRAD